MNLTKFRLKIYYWRPNNKLYANQTLKTRQIVTTVFRFHNSSLVASKFKSNDYPNTEGL